MKTKQKNQKGGGLDNALRKIEKSNKRLEKLEENRKENIEEIKEIIHDNSLIEARNKVYEKSTDLLEEREVEEILKDDEIPEILKYFVEHEADWEKLNHKMIRRGKDGKIIMGVQ
ncbi:MAG: hypothetical protein ACLFUR_06455 [Candidatus Hadarchaeia archaeon]